MLQMAVLLAGVVSSAVIGWFVVTRDPSKRLNQLYGLLTLSFISLTIFNHLTVDPSEHLLTYIRLVVLSTTAASAILFLLTLEIYSAAKSKASPKWISLAVVMLSVGLGLLELSPAVFSGINDSGSSPTPIPNWGIGLFVAHFTFLIASTGALLFWGAKRVHLKERKQFKLMRVGILPILLLAPVTSVLLPVYFGITTFIVLSPLYLVFFLAMVGYAIVRHGLFDVRLAAVRTLAYALSLLTLASIYGFFAFKVSQELLGYQSTASQNTVNIILALMLAFIFQPVKRFFDRVTNRIFFKDRYNTSEFIARFSEVLTTTTDLRTLLQRAAIELGTTLKSEQAFFHVKYSENKHLSAGTRDHSTLSSEEFEDIFSIIKADDTNVVIVDDYPQDSKLRRILASRKIAILMPIRRGKSVLGYLALGDQLSSGYTDRDIRVLETIADELLIAIQNSLSAQEVRDINIHLQERIKAATSELTHSNAKLKKLDKSKDEFISMASHQLRTPLTSVKGYISMTLDGDLGPISDQQREVLEQAFESSQRMAYLIGDFLNVSRLQTGKFELERSTVNLTTMAREEVDQLADTAKTRQIKLVYDQPSQAYFVDGDDNKLRQVMMNFADNAIYYSPAGSTVRVQVIKDATGVAFKVIDAGIGVPPSERPKLFTKFFRATNARRQRPDGTGIGLYMAKKVIVAHGGSIIFETTEGKGSTFGFKLPLKDKLEELDQKPGSTS